ncbi:MAG: hypothetical protein QMD04_10970 [Anaerolineales bacterium]|nr:hypothetical protein [Anaerolineales bacterium]
MSDLEDRYLDVLQNIEFGIVRVYKKHPEMTDWEALRAIEVLIRSYQEESRGRQLPSIAINPLAQETLNSVKAMTDWRLGREQIFDKKGKTAKLPLEPKTVEEIITCLKRIRGSIEKWNKKGGRQGYLNFVSQFVG